MAAVDPLIVKLIADNREFIDSMNRSQSIADRRLDQIEKRGVKMTRNLSAGFNLAKGAAVGFVASLGVDAVVQAVKSGLAYASSLGEVAQQLGVTTDALQEYRYAGSQAGLATEEVDMALSQLTRRIGEAASGTKAQAEAFEKLGVSVKDANGNIIDAGDAIPQIADALQKIESPAERAAILMDLFGRSGQKLEPLLSGGSKAVNELRDAANRLGIVLSSEQIQKADETADKLDAVRQVLASKIAGTVADNADAILALADALAAVVGGAGKAVTALSEFYKAAARKPGNILETITGFNQSTGAPIRSKDYLEGRAITAQQNKAAATARGAVYGPQRRRGGFVAGKSNFAGTGLADLLGIDKKFTPGAGTGLNIKALGTIIDVMDKPAKQVAKKLDEWAIELERVAADVSVARAQLTGSPEEILKAEKQRIEADRIAEESKILGDAKNKSVRDQLLKLNNESAAIQIAVAEREAAAETARQSGDAAEQRLALELQALDDEGRTLSLQASLETNREQRIALAKRMLDIQYEIEGKELEAAIAAGKIADADAARARLKQRQLLDEQQLSKDNARPFQQYLERLQTTDFNLEAEKAGVDTLKDLNSELSRAIVYGGNVGDVLEDSFKRLAAQLIEVAFQLLVIKPLLESIKSGTSGGGGIGGFLASIVSAVSSIFTKAPPRASGGPVSAGRLYRVNEAQQEFFKPNVDGKVLTLGQMSRQAVASSRGGSSQPIVLKLYAEEGASFVPRVEAISAGVSVEVVRTAAPAIQNAAVNETIRRAQRPSIGR